MWLRGRVSAVTRFDATTAAEREALFAAAVTAHRERGSRFLTVEAATVAETDTDEGDGDDGSGGAGDGDADADDPVERVPPWLQFGEGEFNLDCTDGELTALRSLVDDYPEFRIDRLESPETAEATNVGITAHSSEDRLAAFAERVFREVYGQPADFRLWVTAV